MPANDGTAQVWYSLWQPAEDQIRIEHHRLDYDALSAKHQMIKAGMSNGYAEALVTGLWPSLDVLPSWEASQQGKKISETTFLF
jgi:hypothetical protein